MLKDVFREILLQGRVRACVHIYMAQKEKKVFWSGKGEKYNMMGEVRKKIDW